MPIVRSKSPEKSSVQDDSPRTATSDWSLETPVETSSATTSSAASTRTALAPATVPCMGAPTPSAQTMAVPRPAAPATGRSTRTAAAASKGQSRDALTHAIIAPPQRQDMSTEQQKQIRPRGNADSVPAPSSSRNIGGYTSNPPLNSSATLVPPTAPRSTKSTKRLELEARLELQKKQLEQAQAAAALAQTELEIAQYNSEEEIDEEFEAEKSTHVEQWVERTTTFYEEPKRTEPLQSGAIKELADAIISATKTQSNSFASHKAWDLPDFNGNLEEWLPFKRSYQDSAAMFNEVQNMARLRKSIKGTAKETVRSLLFVSSDPSEVMDALERRFGRPEQLVLAEVEKIKELSRLGDTPRDVCVFASRVNNAVNTIQALNRPQYLHSPELSRRIIEKLTPILKYRWYDYSARSPEDPELLKLKKFLNTEADLCGTFAQIETIKRKPPPSRHPVHNTYEEDADFVATTTETPTKRCTSCDGDHWITECKRFRDATVEQRWELAKNKKLCFKCLRQRHMKINCRGHACRKCKRPHHVMLHSERAPQPSSSENEHVAMATQGSAPQIEHVAMQTGENSAVTKSVYAAASGTKAYLKIIPVDVFGPKGAARVLALLDEGSTVTLLDTKIASRIGATGVQEALVLETVGGKIVEKKESQRMDLKIRGAHRKDKRTLKNVRTVESLLLSPQYIRKEVVEQCKHLKERAEELIYEQERPSLLIGQDNWDLIVSRKVVKGKQNEPVASLTSLGWVLHGRSEENVASVHVVNHCHSSCSEDDLDAKIKRHFELESIGIVPKQPSNDIDARAQNVLSTTTNRRPDGRYETGLLWKTDNETLPNNYAQAHNRLVNIERKLDKNPEMRSEYAKQLEHLLANDYAEKAPATTTPGRTFYLPHFAVVHPMKKKMRIVFDAAAKFQGKSLNDALLPGPDLLQPLFGVLLRFRQGPIAVVADIKEMFLQIKVREEDRDSLRYLWRGEDKEAKPQEYRMSSVIFGAASSPATAIFVKNLNAEKHRERHPEAADAIVRNHYMDDYLQSFWNKKEACKTITDVQAVHKKAGFHLRQWASNEGTILRRVAENEDPPNELALGDKEERTLGLRWITNDDTMAFDVSLRTTPTDVIDGTRPPTKREVTSAVMSTFDPMGLIAPILVEGKKLLQDIWRTGTDWDSAIGICEQEKWATYIGKIQSLRDLRIPRCLAPEAKEGELHTFVDASETAYAAACYWRTRSSDGEIRMNLIAGKARVAPVKNVSIPRLELQAALLGGRLASTVTSETDLLITARVFWSDSSTVLQWLKSDPRRFKPFVAHRLAELEDLTNAKEWRWVPSKMNPADDATRSLTELYRASRWFTGPDFLQRPEAEWPAKRFAETDTTEERKKEVVATVVLKEERGTPDPHRFSTWTRLLRSTARVFMFIDLCRKPKTSVKRKPVSETQALLPLEEEHLRKAKLALLRSSQHEAFEEDFNRIRKGLPPKSSSKLKKIDVSIDNGGVLRLNSRIQKLEDADRLDKKPAVLDGKSPIACLLIEHYHRMFYHANHATVMNEIRQRYWILSLRSTVKKIVHRCQWCRVRKARPQMPPTGDLPQERLAHSTYPFTCAAVDYFGPMTVTVGRRKEKRWGVLFTCLTTRAVHLELAPSLSTSSMIMALRRMSARRGTPRVVYSDNATNFVGADRELTRETAKMKRTEVINAAQLEGVTWKFIPPGAPHMGGAWERMVRTVKIALSAVLREKSPPEEVLHTFLTEVEHTVNARPLTDAISEPGSEESLTPNHFLIGRSCGSALFGEFDDSELVGRANWKTTQRLADHFWKRWLREYLPTLMPRGYGGRGVSNLRKGDIVLIVDASLPRNTWPRGEVVEPHVGPDGRTRIADVRTTGGILRRPTSRLVVVVPAATSSP